MDTTDSNDSLLPARLPSSSPHLPAVSAASRPAYDLATVSSTVQISPQGVLRGLARNWWRILMLWAVVSAPMVYLIYLNVEPTYEATSTIRTEPTSLGLYGVQTSTAQAQPIERFIETQISFILTNTVLKPALGDIADLPFIKNSTDKLTDLRQKLRVRNKERTVHIQVSFDSTDPNEAAAIVNAVVMSYLRQYKDIQKSRDEKHVKRLEGYLANLMKEKAAKVASLEEVVERGNVSGQAAGESKSKEVAPKGGASADPAPSPKEAAIGKFSIEQYRSFKADILKKELECNELQYALDKRLVNSQNEDSELSEASPAFLKAQLEARIKDEFKHEPSVAALIQDIQATEDELDHTKNVARKGQDPARKAAEKRRDQLTAKYNDLWRNSYEQIKQQVMAEEASAAASAAASGSGTFATNALSIEALQARLELSRHQLDSLKKLVEGMDLDKKQTQTDTYKAERLKADIDTLTDQYQRIHEKYEDLTFANSDVEIELLDKAIPLSAPTNNKRIKFMLLAPGLVLCLVLGLFALLEVKAERVADPDALSTRVQSEVFSLPPLPMVRASNKLNGPAEDDQIDRFIQRLDHLRFAVCGDHPEVGLGRCVLITSAIGGEGKTTLAAQLAARCGHAGHSTLLIDADLRRGALCPLLDIPEGLGLSDVLKDEANVEDIVIPVQGGTFHLLCAGTPVPDTSRIFQGRNFGMLIARLRQMYDLIIIDSPPVLPVPDGLILGRWTDGAVLASRYDVSRAPQVERARRQLNNAGIPVLGTVINGMKSSDAYYGRYSYSRGRSGYGEPDGSPTT